MNRIQMLQDVCAVFFIAALATLSFISILGVWDVFQTDVIWKSFQTLGLLGIVAIVVTIAGRFVDRALPDPSATPAGSAAFKALRHIALIVLVVSAALLALLGVLAIWEVISERDVVLRSLSSLAIIGFASLITTMVCLQRENHPLLNTSGRRMGGWLILVLIIIAWTLLSVLR